MLVIWSWLRGVATSSTGSTTRAACIIAVLNAKGISRVMVNTKGYSHSHDEKYENTAVNARTISVESPDRAYKHGENTDTAAVVYPFAVRSMQVSYDNSMSILPGTDTSCVDLFLSTPAELFRSVYSHTFQRLTALNCRRAFGEVYWFPLLS